MLQICRGRKAAETRQKRGRSALSAAEARQKRGRSVAEARQKRRWQKRQEGAFTNQRFAMAMGSLARARIAQVISHLRFTLCTSCMCYNKIKRCVSVARVASCG